MNLLSEEFLSRYPEAPEHMNELGSFVYYRTYSRWLEKQGRRETWKEAVTRAVEYNVGISIKQFEKNNFPIPTDKIKAEAEVLFDNIFNLRQFLSGRTHWVGGAESGVADKFPLANFNCAFLEVTKWEDLCDLFYLLLVGTGVGFKCTDEDASKLPPIRTDFELIHSEYNPLPKKERIDRTSVNIMDNGYAKIYIGDSKEGWVEALRWFLLFLTDEEYAHIRTIKISYNSIRPKGERLHTFGGTASGYEPMKEMFEGFEKVIRGEFAGVEPCGAPYDGEEGYVHMRPIHILDMGNLIGNNVVVGGVRRTAEMFICDSNDEEVINAKNEINDNPALAHRRMSNNSIAFTSKPTREELHSIFESIKNTGEPGFINMEQALKRRPNAKGLNPCGEVLLDSYEVCNLTTVNVMGFVKTVTLTVENDEGEEEEVTSVQLDYQGLMEAMALSARAGLRMTCLDLELPHWDKTMKRDRLIACSLTGFEDAVTKLGYDEERIANLQHLLADVVFNEGLRYSHVLRVPAPLLTTTIKPEGTLSQVAGGVSSGLHRSHAPYYIRRIRINSDDALVKVARELNWTVNPDTDQDKDNPRVVVIDFPIKSEATKTRAEQTLEEQFNKYFSFQENYTAHNSSITIYVKDDEWSLAEEIIWERWDDFIGVTFMPYDGGKYELAPYEEISEGEYIKLKSKMKPFNHELLLKYESEQVTTTDEGMEGCESGACAIR